MQVFVNNVAQEISANHLEDLLQQLGYVQSKGIAVAINNEVISKINWSTTPLNENDRITIIRATQGG